MTAAVKTPCYTPALECTAHGRPTFGRLPLSLIAGPDPLPPRVATPLRPTCSATYRPTCPSFRYRQFDTPFNKYLSHFKLTCGATETVLISKVESFRFT